MKFDNFVTYNDRLVKLTGHCVNEHGAYTGHPQVPSMRG